MESGIPVQGNEKHNNSGVITRFFDNLLFLCDFIRQVSETEHTKFLKLSIDDTETEVCLHLGREDDVVELLRFFLCFYGEKSYEKIIVSAQNPKATTVKKYLKSEYSGMEYCFVQYDAKDEKRIDNIIAAFRETFLEYEKQETLKALLGNYRYKLKSKERETFLYKKDIYELLNVYYEVLAYILCNEDILQKEQQKILINILNLGSNLISDEEDTSQAVGMHAPTVLAVMNVVYDCIAYYLAMPESDNRQNNEANHEIFLYKLQQTLRYYMVTEGKEGLYSAAIPNYQTRSNSKKIEELNVPIRNFDNYNSYQGIRELRLAEKIIHEIEKDNVAEREEFHIAILGDIHETPFKDLCEYLGQVEQVRGKKKFPHLKFYIYTHNKRETDKGNEQKLYDYEWLPYANIFNSASELDSLIEQNQLIFFLDNKQLYTPIDVRGFTDLGVFRQDVSYENYEEYYKRNSSQNTLKLKCKFMELYQGLTAYCYSGRFGYFYKQAREEFIKYIQRSIKQTVGKTAYIYVSDLKAFEKLSYVKEHFVRIETYNQKQIGIIKFSNDEEKALSVAYQPKNAIGHSEKWLVFNAWQFIKHVTLNYAKQYKKDFFGQSEQYLLSDIYIGLDYSDWRKRVRISYYIDRQKKKDSINDDKIRNYIAKVIVSAFRSKDDMYGRYLKRAFISFLYGNTKSVEDLLFLHIYDNYQEKIGDIVWDACENKQIYEYYDKQYKYSFKRFYWEVMKQFDMSYTNSLRQYKALFLIEQSSAYERWERDRASVLKEFLQNIVDACKSNGYEDSYLHALCKKEIEER